jgi:hypothetical protein
MLGESNINMDVQMDIDENDFYKCDEDPKFTPYMTTHNDSNKKHPLARASLDLCPRKWQIEDPEKTDNQYSLNVELDDADYLNVDPLEEQVHVNDFEMDCKENAIEIDVTYDSN